MQVDGSDGQDLAVLYGECLSSNCGDEAEKLLTKIESQLASISAPTLKPLLIPMIRATISVLKQHNLLASQRLSKFVTSLLDALAERYVQREQLKPSDWTRPPSFEATRCGCIDCRLLNTFLQDPRRREENFSMAEKRRKHLGYKLHNTLCDMRTVTGRSPHTLVVTKNDRLWQQQHAQWLTRVNEIKAMIFTLPQDELRALLGARYDDIVDLKSIKHGYHNTVMNNVSGNANRVPGVGGGGVGALKRKATDDGEGAQRTGHQAASFS